MVQYGCWLKQAEQHRCVHVITNDAGTLPPV